MIDPKAVRGLENTVVTMKRVTTTHMLAEIMAKRMSANEIFSRLIEAAKYLLKRTHQEPAVEQPTTAAAKAQSNLRKGGWFG